MVPRTFDDDDPTRGSARDVGLRVLSPSATLLLLLLLGVVFPRLSAAEQIAGTVTTVAGYISGSTTVGSTNNGYADGRGTASMFNHPYGVAMDTTGTLAIIVRREGMVGANVSVILTLRLLWYTRGHRQTRGTTSCGT